LHPLPRRNFFPWPLAQRPQAQRPSQSNPKTNTNTTPSDRALWRYSLHPLSPSPMGPRFPALLAPCLSQMPVSLSCRGTGAAPRPPLETAVLAGRCFLGAEGVFAHGRGGRDVVVGYAGGSGPGAHDDRVSTGQTGQVEAVGIRCDPGRSPTGRG
jgi:hypothetical protein